MKKYARLHLENEHLLFSYLDEYMNANGVTPRLSGQDSEGTPFLAWLNEEGGDSVYLTVARLVTQDGGTSEQIMTDVPSQGDTSLLVYPVAIMDWEDKA